MIFMVEHQDSGTIAEDTQTNTGLTETVTSGDPGVTGPEPEQQKPKKKAKAETPSEILRCSNGCGFMTRYPKAQALAGDMCPMCDRNGMSSKLVPYP